jgi:signal peptidase I
MRTVLESTVRIQVLLLLPAALVLLGLSAARGGWWLAFLPPTALGLTAHARLVARLGFRAWAPSIGTISLAVAGVSMALLVAGPVLGLYRTVTVLSGSMQPTFNAGDVIIVTPEPMHSLRVGQVISFQAPIGDHQVETHRIATILRPGADPIVQTKGDANTSLDPWQAQLHGSTLWHFRLRVPLVGYPILWLRTPWAHRITVLILPALIALWLLGKLWLPPSSRRVESHA